MLQVNETNQMGDTTGSLFKFSSDLLEAYIDDTFDKFQSQFSNVNE